MNSCARILAILAIVALALAACAPNPGGGGGPDPTQWFVSPSGADSGECHSLLAPCKTITYVLTMAQPGDTIRLSSGTFSEKIFLSHSLTVIGEGPEHTAIDGMAFLDDQSVVTVMGCGKCTVMFQDLAVKNGSGDVSGGGLNIQDFGMVQLSNVAVLWNKGLIGGGMYIRNAQVSMNQSYVEGNQAVTGGGIFIEADGTLTINAVDIKDNRAPNNELGNGGNGGGVFNAGVMNFTSVTITGNEAEQKGGGVYNAGTFNGIGLAFRENTAHNGGGLLNLGVATLDTLSMISNHAAGSGGGLMNGLPGAPEGARANLSNVLFADNQAGDGGGVAVFQDLAPGIPPATAVTITAGTFRTNMAFTFGGGIFNDGGTVNVANTTLQGNGADSGGGYFTQGNAYGTFTNVTFGGNVAIAGSAIGTQAKSLDLVNVTIANNSGSGLAISSVRVDALNLLLAYNSPANCEFINPGEFITAASLSSDLSCHLAGPLDLDNVDPLLGPLADNGGVTQTYALLAGSPAIDAGNGFTAPMVDQRGIARPLDGNADGVAWHDIGAFELAPQTMSQSVPGGSPQWEFAQPANCRQGPGSNYPVVTSFATGKLADVDGCSADNLWLHLSGYSCWVGRMTGRLRGDSSGLAVLVAPAPPTDTPEPPTPVPACVVNDPSGMPHCVQPCPPGAVPGTSCVP